MRLALVSSAWALGILSIAGVGCSHHERTVQSRPYEPTAEEQRRIDERRAEERRVEELKAEERKAEERRVAEERRLADLRRAEEEQRREDERRTADRRAEERKDRSIGGGPNDALRATPASALASIAAARCDRELRCKHIGPKEKYRTRAVCVTELKRDKVDDFNSDVCPGGIREKELNDCLQSIREEDCGNPLDTLTRLNTCRSGSLCVK